MNSEGHMFLIIMFFNAELEKNTVQMIILHEQAV